MLVVLRGSSATPCAFQEQKRISLLAKYNTLSHPAKCRTRAFLALATAGHFQKDGWKKLGVAPTLSASSSDWRKSSVFRSIFTTRVSWPGEHGEQGPDYRDKMRSSQGSEKSNSSLSSLLKETTARRRQGRKHTLPGPNAVVPVVGWFRSAEGDSVLSSSSRSPCKGVVNTDCAHRKAGIQMKHSIDSISHAHTVLPPRSAAIFFERHID